MVVNFYYKDLSSSYAGTLDETAKQLRMNHNHVKCVRKRKLSIIDIMSVSNYKLVDKNSKNKLITFCKNLVNLNFNNLITQLTTSNKNRIILSSLKKELYFIKFNNEKYFGFFDEILEKINFRHIKKYLNLSEIINERLNQKIKDYLNVGEIKEENFDYTTLKSFIKDEFESQMQFDERINQFIEKEKLKNDFLIVEYKKRVENLKNVKKNFLFESFAQIMGIPILKNAFYDSETRDMYVTLIMSNCLWGKRVKINIINIALAKDFKTKLNEVKVDVTFDFENEEFIFDKVELEFGNNKFTAEESKEQEKQEVIKIDFKLVTDEKDLETSKDIQLPKYALEVKTLDNQKLEDKIQILKEKLQISDDKNRELNNNNQILIKKIDEMKKSTLYFENVLKIKDNEIVSLKSAITYIKNNQKEYQDILKDNQLLKHEIEELKKYYSKSELNFSMKEEGQKISKVVERESFSDF